MTGKDNRPSLKPHATDVVSLVFGLIFLSAVGWWLLARVASITTGEVLGWAIAGNLMVVGAIGLLAAVRPTPRRRRKSSPPR